MWRFYRMIGAVACSAPLVTACEIVAPEVAADEIIFAQRYTLVLTDEFGRAARPIELTVPDPDDGRQVPLAVHHHAWAPDGRTIAVAATRGALVVCSLRACESRDLYTYSLESGEIHRVPGLSGSMHAVDWAAGSDRLVVAAAPSGYLVDKYRMRLLVVDVVTAQVDTIDVEPRRYYDVRWSPDGQRIATVASRGPRDDLEFVLRVASLDGAEEEIMSSTGGLRIDWSPLSEQLLVTEPLHARTLYTYDLATGTKTDVPLADNIRFVTYARWSRDARKILLALNFGPSNLVYFDETSNVAVMTAEGGAATVLDRGHMPEWRPRP
jgi:dipeptidyl aminopeptidase/acylaminoacyl peptidase